jgi:hypothetical protein
MYKIVILWYNIYVKECKMLQLGENSWKDIGTALHLLDEGLSKIAIERGILYGLLITLVGNDELVVEIEPDEARMLMLERVEPFDETSHVYKLYMRELPDGEVEQV